MPGVEVTADSVENDSFLPQLAADGKKNAGAGRWSSANEAGAPEHWLQFFLSTGAELCLCQPLLGTSERAGICNRGIPGRGSTGHRPPCGKVRRNQ